MAKFMVWIGALLLMTTSRSWAWGGDGHRVVASLAMAQLTVKARSEVDRLLALEPGATLVSISTWADEHRNPTTGSWHYVNFPRDTCQYDPDRDCPSGNCVVAAIERQSAVLASDAPDEKRLMALKYLVHFVGDVHQPLHAGYLDDKGGNTYQLQALMRGTNLHALWDSGIIRSGNEEAGGITARLLMSPLPPVSNDLNSVHAAEESCRIVGMPDFYPERRVGMDYIERYRPVLEQRLSLAGARLGGMLNRLLGSR